MLTGIKGQVQSVENKGRDTYEEKVVAFYDDIKQDVSVMSPFYNKLSYFRTLISDRFEEFDEKCDFWRDQLDATDQKDLEADYQAILTEFEQIKDKFNCVQCGGNIAIDRIYFITKHLECPQCQTQNTFEPSTKARGLEHLARSLAEQRTQHLLVAYQNQNDLERKIYHERHTLSLNRINSDKNERAKIEQEMEILEQKRLDVIKNTPEFYKIYLRAMFDEWNKITPDLTEQNNKFHDRMLADFNN